MLRCIWCEWEGKKTDLDRDEKENPRFCPCCGGEQFVKFKSERVKKHEPAMGKTAPHKK